LLLGAESLSGKDKEVGAGAGSIGAGGCMFGTPAASSGFTFGAPATSAAATSTEASSTAAAVLPFYLLRSTSAHRRRKMNLSKISNHSSSASHSIYSTKRIQVWSLRSSLNISFNFGFDLNLKDKSSSASHSIYSAKSIRVRRIFHPMPAKFRKRKEFGSFTRRTKSKVSNVLLA
jgi:hypothetical protein